MYVLIGKLFGFFFLYLSRNNTIFFYKMLKFGEWSFELFYMFRILLFILRLQNNHKHMLLCIKVYSYLLTALFRKYVPFNCLVVHD